LFPQPWVQRDGGEAIRLDDFAGTGWQLLTMGSVDAPTSAGVTVVRLGGDVHEVDNVLRRWMATHDCCAALVRPDHYVFGTAASPGEIRALLDEMHRRLR